MVVFTVVKKLPAEKYNKKGRKIVVGESLDHPLSPPP